MGKKEKGIDHSRRNIIKAGITGLAAITCGSAIGVPNIFKQEAHAAKRTVELLMIEAWHEMVDETLVYSWAYQQKDLSPTLPGPVIFATEGDTLEITVRNTLDEDHGFAIPGNTPGTFIINTGAIGPNRSATVSFAAPPAGTYMYTDPVNSPVGRVLGLHGLLIVMPASGNTPYGSPPSSVQELFNDLGASHHFPGLPWDPARTNIWVFSQIDPAWNERARRGEAINTTAFVDGFLPRYYTINGRSGFFAAHDHHDIGIKGRAGEPRLIRNVNVGLAAASPHAHANHVYMLSVNGRVQSNLWWVDTWTMEPEDRKDLLYPMTKPPDIPDDTWARLIAGTSEEGFPENPMTTGPPGFPMFYPMHCHFEISQTSAGGNYPQGLMTHIEFTGVVGANGD